MLDEKRDELVAVDQGRFGVAVVPIRCEKIYCVVLIQSTMTLAYPLQVICDQS